MPAPVMEQTTSSLSSYLNSRVQGPIRLMASKKEGIHVAPWPRVYADLRLVGVRGEEAAEHLRDRMRGQ